MEVEARFSASPSTVYYIYLFFCNLCILNCGEKKDYTITKLLHHRIGRKCKVCTNVTNLWFAEIYSANIYSGDWVDMCINSEKQAALYHTLATQTFVGRFSSLLVFVSFTKNENIINIIL